ncbi:MAG: hypothetical protein A2504_14115 [Bdellovibrionales bacterium RIFOXYD12_FULL_39_22]|nr:MAG: hypothetical protein A2385_04550 [Bdellovibrionales bacterium RIFOXYB1_FULL_39_21]OFZ43418.1 MAG: hypothetical protein A2485_13065 [Bdellovibrionales bacterium RIFOXYC12_FULL_39_17]OFZ46961.1 MAG: hypothetical protein A2404_00125 [Bdellovibrionales bacterium RIFOXYC1_FULL_39_130]OFZ76158.1 MAG: hypothetical protein A2560_07375 [Bdellovibrionales bacterium RIFOXYD1_FULL_39_84]OFZ94393.1 MAG: hypothetical protein A2504_14115 [Bdellovibrionales bacterium RIFOXYD12_FULL_39_22]HLE10567.1 hy
MKQTLLFLVISLSAISWQLLAAPTIIGIAISTENIVQGEEYAQFHRNFLERIKEAEAIFNVDNDEATMIVCAQNILKSENGEDLNYIAADFFSSMLSEDVALDFSANKREEKISAIQAELVLGSYSEALFVYFIREFKSQLAGKEELKMRALWLQNFIIYLNVSIIGQYEDDLIDFVYYTK